MNSRSFFLSALIAGVAIGLLGNLPVLNLINCFLCIWVWVGGILAVFLYRRFEHGGPGLTGGQGAGLGALSGLIGAFVGVVVYALTSFISMPLFNNLARSFDIQGDLPWDAGGFPGIHRVSVLLPGGKCHLVPALRRHQRVYHRQSIETSTKG